MAISVGDAVLTFLGDTQNLDRAFDKVNQDANSKLGNAEQSVRSLDTSFLNAGRSGSRAGDQIVDTGARSRRSIEEARGAVDLLGDQLGLRIPRELKHIIAQSELAGQALDAAFKAVAIVALISFAVELGEKLGDIISKTFIFTDAMQKAQAAQIELNKRFIAAAEQQKAADDEYRKASLTTIQLLQDAQSKLRDEIIAKQEEIRVARDEAFWAERNGDKETANAKRSIAAALSEELDTLRTKEATVAIGLEKEQTKAAQEETQKRIANAEAASQAIIQFAKAAAKFQELRDVLGTPPPGVFIKTSSEDLKNLGDIAAGPGSATEKVKQLADAYQTLGLSISEFDLAKKEADQRRAIAVLKEQGAAVDDVNRAYLALNEILIQKAKIQGKDTAELEKERKGLIRLLPELKQHGQVAKQVASQVGAAVLQESFAFGQGTISIGQSLRQLTAVIIQEIAKQAEVRGAAKLAEALGEVFHNPAAAAGDFAAAAAWFALAGGISAAAGAVAGGSATPGTVANPVNVVDNSPVSQPQQPSQRSNNIQRFATGALISQPTLAIVGDSRAGGRAREGVLPLDDPDAMEAIAGAIADRIGGDGGPRIVNHINVRSMTTTRATAELAKNLTKMVDSGRARLKSTDSRKLTRRG